MSRILLVDDDVDLAELIKTKLVSEGHEIHMVNTGEGAFELAKRVKPEIAILDIMLPGVTGYQICRRLRIDPELYKTAILLLTALGEEPEVMHGLEQGADDYIVKPFKLDKLMEKLSSLASLLQAVERRNPITRLPGTDAVKREINHRLARNIPTAACYIDVTNFKAYSASRGQNGQQQAMEYIGKMLVGLTRNMGVYESFVSHMGGEHFVVVVNLDDYERFCNGLIETFDQRSRELYTAQELSQGYVTARDRRGQDGRYGYMLLSIGVSHNQNRPIKSAKKMLEILSQVRQKAQPKDKSIVFVDRRRTDR